MKYLIVVSTILFSATAFAGSVGTLNTFNANTTASSSDVNQNFDDIKTEVNDNDGRITTNTGNITSNGNDIGTNTTNIGVNTGNITNNGNAIGVNAGDITDNGNAIGVNAGNITANTNSISGIQQSLSVTLNGTRIGTYLMSTYTSCCNQAIYVLSDTGYIFGINNNVDTGGFGELMFLEHASGGNDSKVYYESAGCLGQAYIQKYELYYLGVGMFAHSHGIVFSIKGDALYLAKNTTPNTYSYASFQYDTLACNNASGSLTDLLPVSTNDPLVTGVSMTTFFPQPLLLEK